MEKTDLKNYRALTHEVKQLRGQLKALGASIDTGERHEELVAMYRRTLTDKEAEQLAVEEAIQSLGDTPERIIMRERYILGKEWAEVVHMMKKLGISERQVYRLHGWALQRINKA